MRMSERGLSLGGSRELEKTIEQHVIPIIPQWKLYAKKEKSTYNNIHFCRTMRPEAI
jgi:hypothetical protein